MAEVGNNVTFIGRLTRDAEIHEFDNGDKSASFCLARNRYKPKSKDGSEESHPESDFINCRAGKGTSVLIEQYTSKGMRIGVHGSLRSDKYTDKDGNDKYWTGIMVDRIEFLDSKKEGNSEVPNALDGSEEQELPF